MYLSVIHELINYYTSNSRVNTQGEAKYNLIVT